LYLLASLQILWSSTFAFSCNLLLLVVFEILNVIDTRYVQLEAAASCTLYGSRLNSCPFPMLEEPLEVMPTGPKVGSCSAEPHVVESLALLHQQLYVLQAREPFF
jgi:hypothetical protein